MNYKSHYELDFLYQLKYSKNSALQFDLGQLCKHYITDVHELIDVFSTHHEKFYCIDGVLIMKESFSERVSQWKKSFPRGHWYVKLAESILKNTDKQGFCKWDAKHTKTFIKALNYFSESLIHVQISKIRK